MAGNSGRYKGRRSNEPRRHNPRESERTLMLGLHRISTFRYGMREIMTNYKIDESVASSVIASVIAKSSRISIDSAKTYIRDQEKEGKYPKIVSDEVCDLLERFSKYR